MRYTPLWLLLLVPFGFGASACDSLVNDNQPLGSFITLNELDQLSQPTTADGGVLVAMASRGGGAVRISVSGGRLDPASFGGTAACAVGSADDDVVLRLASPPDVTAFALSVHPSALEATIWATLGELSAAAAEPDAEPETSCAGRFVAHAQSAVLVVSLGRAASPPAPDANAESSDANSEASGSSAAAGDE